MLHCPSSRSNTSITRFSIINFPVTASFKFQYKLDVRNSIRSHRFLAYYNQSHRLILRNQISKKRPVPFSFRGFEMQNEDCNCNEKKGSKCNYHNNKNNVEREKESLDYLCRFSLRQKILYFIPDKLLRDVAFVLFCPVLLLPSHELPLVEDDFFVFNSTNDILKALGWIHSMHPPLPRPLPSPHPHPHPHLPPLSNPNFVSDWFENRRRSHRLGDHYADCVEFVMRFGKNLRFSKASPISKIYFSVQAQTYVPYESSSNPNSNSNSNLGAFDSNDSNLNFAILNLNSSNILNDSNNSNDLNALKDSNGSNHSKTFKSVFDLNSDLSFSESDSKEKEEKIQSKSLSYFTSKETEKEGNRKKVSRVCSFEFMNCDCSNESNGDDNDCSNEKESSRVKGGNEVSTRVAAEGHLTLKAKDRILDDGGTGKKEGEVEDREREERKGKKQGLSRRARKTLWRQKGGKRRIHTVGEFDILFQMKGLEQRNMEKDRINEEDTADDEGEGEGVGEGEKEKVEKGMESSLVFHLEEKHDLRRQESESYGMGRRGKNSKDESVAEGNEDAMDPSGVEGKDKGNVMKELNGKERKKKGEEGKEEVGFQLENQPQYFANQKQNKNKKQNEIQNENKNKNKKQNENENQMLLDGGGEYDRSIHHLEISVKFLMYHGPWEVFDATREKVNDFKKKEEKKGDGGVHASRMKTFCHSENECDHAVFANSDEFLNFFLGPHLNDSLLNRKQRFVRQLSLSHSPVGKHVLKQLFYPQKSLDLTVSENPDPENFQNDKKVEAMDGSFVGDDCHGHTQAPVQVGQVGNFENLIFDDMCEKREGGGGGEEEEEEREGIGKDVDDFHVLGFSLLQGHLFYEYPLWKHLQKQNGKNGASDDNTMASVSNKRKDEDGVNRKVRNEMKTTPCPSCLDDSPSNLKWKEDENDDKGRTPPINENVKHFENKTFRFGSLNTNHWSGWWVDDANFLVSLSEMQNSFWYVIPKLQLLSPILIDERDESGCSQILQSRQLLEKVRQNTEEGKAKNFSCKYRILLAEMRKVSKLDLEKALVRDGDTWGYPNPNLNPNPNPNSNPYPNPNPNPNPVGDSEDDVVCEREEGFALLSDIAKGFFSYYEGDNVWIEVSRGFIVEKGWPHK